MDSKTLAIVLVLGAVALGAIIWFIYWKWFSGNDDDDKGKGTTGSNSADDFFTKCDDKFKAIVKEKLPKISDDERFKHFVAGMVTIVSITKDNYAKALGVADDKKDKLYEEIKKVVDSIKALVNSDNKEEKKTKITEIKQLSILADLIESPKDFADKKPWEDANNKPAVEEVMKVNDKNKTELQTQVTGKDYNMVQYVVASLKDLFKDEITAATA